MKINFKLEIIECFNNQFSERVKEYESFFISVTPMSNKELERQMLLYADLLEDLDFLIKLITSLENGQR